ncbi:hypothetical protein PV08_08083 [Exophiala spinifera]|uniref:Uncharacterized protein n=1 Tax=Exophiala spinifera TaxID=91928 RepID=A0A0D1YD63_9EURO|nr:uncharacterized protein PV08_08083 [Exophiala spinifera]KIW12896.1 hypothetical protein PV08_08083 [Exophiala spinifera]
MNDDIYSKGDFPLDIHEQNAPTRPAPETPLPAVGQEGNRGQHAALHEAKANAEAQRKADDDVGVVGPHVEDALDDLGR